VLAELELPAPRLIPALLGFNVGVEAGQLVVLALLWPLLLAARRSLADGSHRALVGLTSSAVCGLGVFWFVTRAYG
jgi:hypothetical protein